MREPLTDREMDILIMITEGKTNREISLATGCKIETVKSHVAHVLYKLNSVNRAQAVANAYHHGVLRPRVAG